MAKPVKKLEACTPEELLCHYARTHPGSCAKDFAKFTRPFKPNAANYIHSHLSKAVKKGLLRRALQDGQFRYWLADE